MVDGGGITLDYLVCRTFINVLNYAHNTLNTPLAIAQRLPTPTTLGCGSTFPTTLVPPIYTIIILYNILEI